MEPIKLSVSISAVLGKTPFREALPLVRAAGLDAYEFWGWEGLDLAEIAQLQADCGLTCVAFCTSAFDLVTPEKRPAYREGLLRSLEAAARLHCNRLITQVGQDNGRSRQEQRDSLQEGLAACAKDLEGAGVTLLVEPLNTLVDHKGYFLSSSAEGVQIIKEVGSPQVKLLFDIYHQQIMEGNLIANIQAGLDCIGHFHAAGNPGRHDPWIGEINYGQVLQAIEQMGFSGYCGLEYRPEGDALASLTEAKRRYR